MTQHLINHPLFIQSHSIAAFYAFYGEIDPAFILKQALQLNKKCYLPIINKYSEAELVFCEIDNSTQYLPNQYGILEPKITPLSHCLSALEFDLVLVPLLGIDKQGHRLGRGGGFYDRAFQFKKNTKNPILIGLAYDLQYLDSIPFEAHDIKLDGLVTEKGFFYFK